VGYGEQHMWTHKSGLTRLPYYDNLLLPHNIDVMHTEKNVAEALWATIMDIPDNSKDNVKARVDLAALCDRPNQEMKPPSGGKTWRRPKGHTTRMCHVTIQKQKEIAEAAAQQSQPKQVMHTASYHSPYIPEYVGNHSAASVASASQSQTSWQQLPPPPPIQ
jgi:hypothetical protein